MATPHAARSSTHTTRQVIPWHVVSGAKRSWLKLGQSRAESGGTSTLFPGAGPFSGPLPAAPAGFACGATMTSADANVVPSAAPAGLCSAPCKFASGCPPLSPAGAALYAGSALHARPCGRCNSNA